MSKSHFQLNKQVWWAIIAGLTGLVLLIVNLIVIGSLLIRVYYSGNNDSQVTSLDTKIIDQAFSILEDK